MPRIPRLHLVEQGATNHCTWRSHNHSLVLDSDEAKRKFLSLLAKYKGLYGIRIHSYCLMGTHPHVVCTADRGQPAFSAFWKVVNQTFARWFNLRSRRKGQVVMQRLRSPLIKPDGRHLLTVMRYGDLNPVRARLVRSAADWKWSSFRHYAFGASDPLIDDAPDYLALGSTPTQRRKAYLHLFARRLVAPLLVRRPDFVELPFIGDEAWVRARTEPFLASPS